MQRLGRFTPFRKKEEAELYQKKEEKGMFVKTHLVEPACKQYHQNGIKKLNPD
jgi:hypothetical protein